MSTGTIVLVDDEEFLLRLFGMMVEEFGFRAITFSDPKKALIFIQNRKQNPDLVITDFRMPQMNGAELINEIKKIKPEIGAICMSGMPDNLKMAKKLGCENVLLKPFSVKELEMKIFEVIN